MQEMTADVCKDSSVGDSNTLTDTRDNSTYTVKKLNDSQCWMTQNLRIVDKSISSADSNIVSGTFTIPASSATPNFSSNSSNAYYPNDTTKGTYYSWCTATAGSCTSATSTGVNAPSSICPKGWHLPVGGTGTTGTNTGAISDTKNDFMVLTGKTTTSSFKDASLISGGLITLGGATWPFTGWYSGSNLVSARGIYWSRTASGSSYAYALDASNSGPDTGNVALANTFNRPHGITIRCVAYTNQ